MQSLKKTFTNGLIVLGLLFGVMVSATADDLFDSDMILAQEGNPIGQFNIGYSYDSGKGVRQDYAKAKEWYQKAADQGYGSAQYNLALKYDEGIGIRQDYAKAISLYKKAADQGHDNAQLNLSYLYIKGKGVRQDYAKAKEWAGKSCDNGNQAGCDNYRILNEQGH